MEIVERASTIDERLGDDFVPAEGGDAALVDERLEAWSQALGKGDWDRLRRRLAWDGLDPGDGSPRSRPRASARGRASSGVVGAARGGAPPGPNRATGGADEPWPAEMGFLDAEDALPFEEVLAPFVLVARERLAGRTVAFGNLLSAAARAALERSLLRSLSSRLRRTTANRVRDHAWPGTVVLGSVVRAGTRTRRSLPVPAVRPSIG